MLYTVNRLTPSEGEGEAMDEMDTGLPASIEAAWGRRERPSKGPKPGLSLERIVDAAVQVAASDGLESVSMSRVAAELGSSTMSLYRYVAAKDELLSLMVDAVMPDAVPGAPPAPPESDENWRAGLSRWAWAYHRVLRLHPWVLRVPISAPPVTPNLTAWLENGLRTLSETRLTEPEKLSVLLLLSGFVRNEAALAADIGAASATEQQIMPRWGQLLASLTDAERFPALHAALASEAFEQDDNPDDEFVFGLERILDGVAALVRTRTRHRS
jgi:AcrR family transcriptional regulator